MLPTAATIVGLQRQLMATGRPEAELVRIARTHDLAIRLFGARFRASGVPFVCHLVGTASILAAAGSRVDVVVAGLLHAAYRQGDFRGSGAATAGDRRRLVADAAGPAAEALVHAYAAFPWPAGAAEPTADPDLVRIRIANEIDDHRDGAMLFARKASREPSGAEGAAIRAAARAHPPLDAWLDHVLADRPEVPDAPRRTDAVSFDAGPRGRLLGLRLR
jgi:hypothetical protein